MNIVITMAGIGSRFLKKGYNLPKYMIEVKNKTLFEWSLLSLVDYNQHLNPKYIFVVKKKDHAKDFITTKLRAFNIQNFTIVELDNPTDGQATSAIKAEPFWDSEDELVIYNIDTYIEPNTLKYSDIKGDGFIPCFKAPGTHWSFVKLDKSNKVTEIREKERISDNCTIGLYYFKTCKLYKELYNAYYSKNPHQNTTEKYIAPLYNQMIKQNLEVKIKLIPENKVHILGTPEEVNTFANL